MQILYRSLVDSKRGGPNTFSLDVFPALWEDLASFSEHSGKKEYSVVGKHINIHINKLYGIT